MSIVAIETIRGTVSTEVEGWVGMVRVVTLAAVQLALITHEMIQLSKAFKNEISFLPNY